MALNENWNKRKIVKEKNDIEKQSKTQLSKYISYLLRHHPETLGLEMDKFGYVNVEDFISKINGTKKYVIDKDILETIVKEDEKQRYSYSVDKTLIRANQGHSFEVDTLTKKVPNDILYHGTSKLVLDAIKKEGIKKMSRAYVHLSADIETAQKVALRHAKKQDNVIILIINAPKMVEDGYDFYISDNGVWNIDYVPAKYILDEF
jgi:putative RNA 2'-phosphotransferase